VQRVFRGRVDRCVSSHALHLVAAKVVHRLVASASARRFVSYFGGASPNPNILIE
jgi:hypothetical protein